mgnify:CR=1 FL=1
MADKHENPADVLLHELVDMPGFETYVVCNNQGIVLKYVGMEYERSKFGIKMSDVTSLQKALRV